MKTVIHTSRKDPLGLMLLDFLNGNKEVHLEVTSPDLDMSKMSRKMMFRSYEMMDALEHMALEQCRGRILDVGSGSGCHALYLQSRGLFVDGLDISPGCIEVMRRRGVKNVIHSNLFELTIRKYSTLLMLMNGLGICGSLSGLNLFLQFVPTILKAGGQILAESTDITPPPEENKRVEENTDYYIGETEFVMRYGNTISSPFEWLYIDFATLSHIVTFNGLQCRKLAADESGRYLVQITLPQEINSLP